MSVAPSHSPPVPTTSPDNREITIVSHSNLFYWWPVWAVGFLLGILSLTFGEKMVTVPANSVAAAHADVTAKKADGTPEDFKDREVIVLPPSKHLHERAEEEGGKGPANPRLHMWPNKGFGVLFATVLLLVIIITNVPLRGMWSVMIIVLVVMLSVIFALARLVGTILHHLGLPRHPHQHGRLLLHLRCILFAIWLFTPAVLRPADLHGLHARASSRSAPRSAAARRSTTRSGMSWRSSAATCSATGSWAWVAATWWSRPPGAGPITSTCPTCCSSARRCSQIEDMLQEEGGDRDEVGVRG